MPFEFRDVQLAVERRDETFKKEKLVTPCVTCTSTGELLGSGGDPVSAEVEDEPDYLWVIAYGDSIPFTVLNKGAVGTQTALAIKIGYNEGSSEREVLGYNDETLPPNISIQGLTVQPDPNSSILRDNLATLRVVPVAGTLTVTVYGMEYNRFGARQPFPTATFDLTAYKPASGKKRWVLLYLDMISMVMTIVEGVIGPDHPTHVLPKPNTPLFGFGTAYISLSGTDTEILDTNIEDARRTLYPNKVSGVIYNKVVTDLVIPPDTTYIRGVLVVEAGQALRISDGGRVIVL